MSTRREFIGAAAAGLLAAQGRRPNFLFLFPDQHRYDWTGSNRDLPLRTPNLDALARRGVEFTRAGRVTTPEESFATTRRGVFAAGDIVNGGTTVVQAVAEGARAAREIHQYLRG